MQHGQAEPARERLARCARIGRWRNDSMQRAGLSVGVNALTFVWLKTESERQWRDNAARQHMACPSVRAHLPCPPPLSHCHTLLSRSELRC